MKPGRFGERFGFLKAYRKKRFAAISLASAGIAAARRSLPGNCGSGRFILGLRTRNSKIAPGPKSQFPRAFLARSFIDITPMRRVFFGSCYSVFDASSIKSCSNRNLLALPSRDSARDYYRPMTRKKSLPWHRRPRAVEDDLTRVRGNAGRNPFGKWQPQNG